MRSNGCRTATTILAIVLCWLSQAALAAAEHRKPSVLSLADGCEITRPPAQPLVPPKTFPSRPASANYFWYGSDGLWVRLRTDGLWQGGHTESGTVDRFWWWRANNDWLRENRRQLRVSVTRVGGGDEGAFVSTVREGHFPGGPAMATMITLPPGCWNIRGRYKDDSVSFVVLVER